MKTAACENELCIYCENGKCGLSEISLNNMGICESAVCVCVDEEYIALQKEKLRKRLAGNG